MDTLLQDLRYAVRSLVKARGVAAVAILTLVIGIGATTAVFTVLSALLLHPLPYRQPDRLVLLWGNTVRNGVTERRGGSYPDFRDWRSQSSSFESMAAFWNGDTILTGQTESERLLSEVVSANYFDLLGVRPFLGRTFVSEEDQPSSSSPTVLLSYGLWQRRFGSDPAIIGKTIQLDRRNYEVAGILPQGFRGLTDNAELWFSTMILEQEVANDRGSRWLQVVARLKPGVATAQAQTEIRTVAERLAQAYPRTNDQRGVEIIGLQQELVSQMRKPVLISFGAVLLVLLIACVNVSNLMLARAEARQREIAIRYALGATRAHTLRQAFTESAVLALCGVGLGLALAKWTVQAMLALSPVQLPGYVDLALNGKVLAFTAVIAAATAILVGIVPGLHFWRRDLSSALGNSSARTGQSLQRRNVRSGLVITEVALAIFLLIGAGLLLRSFQKLIALDPGFDPSNVLTIRLNLGRESDPNVKLANRALALLDRIRPLHGVVSASLSNDVPLDGNAGAVFYTPEGNTIAAEQKRPRAYRHVVSPDFFSTLGIRLLRGRTFTAAEMSSDTKAVIVSDDVVRRYWPNEEPIGKRLKSGGPASQSPWYEVVGVVEDVKYRAIPRNPTPDPDLYFPLTERSQVFSLAIRATQDPGQLTQTVRNEIRNFDASVPIYDVATMRDRIGTQLSTPRFASALVTMFAAIALLLALIGTYSVMSYLVSQRTSEIGVRLALGARPSQIFTQIVGQGFALAGAGTVVGIVAALILQRLISALLFGIDAANPLVIIVVALLMLGSSVLACYLPAKRATQVDPMIALRYE
jgi:predicted permease